MLRTIAFALAILGLIAAGTAAAQLIKFRPPTVYSTSPGYVYCIALGDVNRDGKQDLVAASYEDGLSVFLGNGAGLFESSSTLRAGRNPIALALVDVNRDSENDLVVALQTDRSISVLLGIGDGTFGPRTNFPISANPTSMAVGDINRDGILDLAIGASSPGSVVVLLGVGDGTYLESQVLSAGEVTISVALADFDRNSDIDLIATDLQSGIASVWLGIGGGEFGTRMTMPVGGLPRQVAVADLDGDDRDDFVVANQADGTATVGFGRGDGSFEPPLILTVGTGIFDTAPQWVSIADFNGDGLLDVCVGSEGAVMASSAKAVVFPCLGSRSFGVQQQLGIDPMVATMVLGYVTGESYPAIVVGGLSQFFVFVNQNGLPHCIGDADGDWEVDWADLNEVLSNWGAMCPSLCLGDANGDHQVNFGDVTDVLTNWQVSCE